jgi:2-keto-4-pentenoate hydratase/2-oxohepta-3-ene-1,7-dioic acid hydratase in catechol pathway
MHNTYRHQFTSGAHCQLPVGKVVCVGRNYAEHARELNNPIPEAPLLFMKPAPALVPFSPGFTIPVDRGSVHHELEMALLLGQPLSHNDEATCLQSIVGAGLALDLTLRDVQAGLKRKGHPWEVAKSFDGSCPCSDFVPIDQVMELQDIDLRLLRNDQLQQQGNTRDMLFPVAQLLVTMNQSFSLQPGDVVLTGTPAGVGPLHVGDQLAATLGGYLQVAADVSAAR